MSKLNSFLSSVLSGNAHCYQLPRLRPLGSRLLNALVILAMLVPNLTFVVEAAVPQAQTVSHDEAAVEIGSAERMDNLREGGEYNPPEFTHPQPRTNASLDAVNVQGAFFSAMMRETEGVNSTISQLRHPIELQESIISETFPSAEAGSPASDTELLHPSVAFQQIPREWSGTVSSHPRQEPLQAPPSNDDFDQALVASSFPYNTFTDVSEATSAADDPVISCLGSTGTNSVWYEVIPDADGLMRFDTSGSAYDTVLAVWTGSRGSLSQEICSDDANGTQASNTLFVTGGTSYYVEIVSKQAPAVGDLSLSADFVSTQTSGVEGTYYDTVNLDAETPITRQDSMIDFAWGQGSPMAEIGPDGFSIRWTGRVEAEYTEAYTFHTLSDDGVRLWVDGQLLIDNWTIHGPTWDTGSLALQAGEHYTLRMEYFEQGGDATAQLDWSSPSTLQETVPAAQLSTLDLENSTVAAGPIYDDNGTDTSTITVTLQSSSGDPVADQQVYLQVTGQGNAINGVPVAEGDWFNIGFSGYDGSVTAELSSTTSENKVISARTQVMPISDEEEINFIPPEMEGFQILIYGESPDPGTTSGKTGIPELIFPDEPTTFEIRAVDGSYNLVSGYQGTVILDLSDPGADYPSSVDLVDGSAVVEVTWSEAGSQNISCYDEPAPGDEPNYYGWEDLAVESSLVIADGETWTVDDDRYAVNEFLSAGSSTIPYDSAVRILPGHEVLIAAMSGAGMGAYETHQVVSVGADALTLSGTLSRDYDGASGKVIVQRVPTYPSVEVQTGGTITGHAWNGSTGGILFFRVDAMGSMTVAAGGTVHANGLGFRNGEGPGAGGNAGLGQGAGGGGHGGSGGDSTGAGGDFYDLMERPFQLGSPGGNKGVQGGAGGGIIYLDAYGLTVEGTISANGNRGYDDYGGSGGGAGGTIQIHAASLEGTGTIRADGGLGGPSGWYGDGGGGAGGRILLGDPFGGSVHAYGGSGQEYGGPGTVYINLPYPETAELIVDNHGHHGEYGGIVENEVSDLSDLEQITLLGYGHLRTAGAASSFQLDQDQLTGDGTGVLAAEGTVGIPDVYTLNGVTLSVEGKLEGGTSDVTLGDGGGLILRAQTNLYSGAHSFGDLTVLSGGQLTLLPDNNWNTDYTDDSHCLVSAANLSVESGGRITSDRRGYGSDRGPGAGGAGGLGAGGGGGGFGGEGGDSTGAGGLTYGDVYQPQSLGSGGGNSDIAAGRGGGAYKLEVTGTLTVDGTLSADGGNGAESYGGSGGGSGGAIWIEAGTFTGSGMILAEGGNGGVSNLHPDGGGGGGGRIAVYAGADTFTGEVFVGGGSGLQAGDEGSKYFNYIDPAASTVVVNPAEVTADGVTEGAIAVTLVDQAGNPLAGEPVEIALESGGQAYLNGQLSTMNEYVSIGVTDSSGQAAGTIAASSLGIRTVKARGGDRQVLLLDRGSVEFVPGPVDQGTSTITAGASEAPADGATSVIITVTARDAQGHPIPGLEVTLSATGDAVVDQPTELTDSQGKTTGGVRDGTIELVTISAAVDGVSLGAQTTVQFNGADPAVTLTGPAEAMAGSEIVQTLQVENLGNTTAQDVVLTLDLPAELSFLSHTAGSEPTVDGNSYTWSWTDLAAGALDEFSVTAEIDGATAEGTPLTSTLTVSTSSTGDHLGNNTTQSTTTVGELYRFTSSLDPSSRTLRVGGNTRYRIEITNQGYLPDTYQLSLVGLDSSWYSFSENPITIAPGGIAAVDLIVEPGGCPVEDTLGFDLTIQADGDGQSSVHAGQLTLDTAPQITVEAPRDGATSGSRSVLFTWRTDPATTGSLTLYPEGSPGEAQTFSTAEGTYHSVEVSDLTRYQTYTWSVQADSACGTAASPDRSLTIGSGIVFTNHNQSATINRDYDQRFTVGVHNEDSVEHTLTASMINPHEDLILNFVGSGSVDETITLAAGETRQLTLAVHAQDAELSEYTLTAELTADEGTGTPIEDQASIHLTVLGEGDFTVTTGDFDPVTLGQEYTITNQGLPITDLFVQANQQDLETPASVYITPNVEHARLGTGESLTITVYPIFTEEDAQQAYQLTGGHLAAPRESLGSVFYDLIVDGGGGDQVVSGASTCEKDFFTVTYQDCEMEFRNNSWYCTNRPEITTSFRLPYFLDPDAVEYLGLGMNFTPRSDVRAHTGQFIFNDYYVDGFSNQIPEGYYQYPVSPAWLNTSQVGMSTQNLQLSTQHPNGGHYVSNTGNALKVGVGQSSFQICAASQAEAEQIAQSRYPCDAEVTFDWRTDVPNDSTENNDDCTDDLECQTSAHGGTQGSTVDPINSRTGVYSLTEVDLSIPTSAGNLIFQRAYSSGMVDETPGSLGIGWTHNHAASLIFPGDPDGQEGFVLFQGVVGNKFLFKVEDDGSFTPGPGVTAALVDAGGSYLLETSAQTELVFDSEGKLLTRSDSEGRTFSYTYNAQGLLSQVAANGGARYLALSYDDQDRLISVADHSGRSVGYTYDDSGDLVSYVDVLGQAWTYAYDAEHRLLRAVDPRGVYIVRTDYDMQGRAYRQFDGEGELLTKIIYHEDGTSTVYDGRGNAELHQHDERRTLAEQTDPAGGTISKTYDDNFRPSSITDAGGNTTSLAWSADGANLTLVEDAQGNQTSLGYDSLNNLTSVTDAQGHTTSYTYDGTLMTSVADVFGETTSYTYTPEGRVESITDPLGNTTSYTYDQYGQMTSMTDALGNTTTYTYDDLGRLVETTDPLGRVTHNEYNAAGQLVRVTENYDPGRPQNDQNQFNIVTEYQYDQVGNRTAVTDTYGNTTTYTYDDNNRLISNTDPAGNTTTHTYDANGNRVAATDALGRTTTYTYDANNRLVATTDPLGNTTTTAYNPDGTVASTTDALGRTTSYVYDDLQRVVSTVDPLGNASGTSYDQLGSVSSTTDALGRVTSYEYDALGRLIRSTDPEGGVTEHFYDAAGNRKQTVDPNGNATTYTYDALGRVETVTDAAGNATTYTYNAAGQRTAVTDALGNTTTYEYDALGRQVSATDPLGNVTTKIYDALGRVMSTTDALGRTMTSAYDALGRLIQRTNPAGGVTEYTYDAVGNQLTVTDPKGHTTTTSYDDLNRPVAVTDPNGQTTTTAYDAAGRVVSTTNALGKTTHFSYDAAGRQTAVTDPLGSTTGYAYDAASNRIEMVDAGGVVTRYEYDGLNRLTAVVENYRPGFTADHETNVRTEYTYDAVGNRLTIKDARDNVTSFSYNELNQLVSESDPLGNTWSYAYDARGSRISMTDANGVATAYSYDALGRRTGIDYPGTAEDVSFDYNAAGQPIEMNDAVGTTTWSYDELGRTVSVNDPFGDAVSYSYDAVGNRTGLTYPDGKSVSYTYDPANQLTGVNDWAGRVTQYSYDPVGRVLSRTLPNGVLSEYDYDAAGQLTALTHAAGADLLSSFVYTYDPVGNRIQAVETLGTQEAGPTVTVTVMDDTGTPLAGIPVYAFDGADYAGFSETTDAAGQVQITLPEGDYRFRADVDGTQFWSGESDHCLIAGCTSVMITVPSPVLVTVQDSAGTPREGLTVYAYSGGEYADFSGTTDSSGQISLRLPEGEYRFRADVGGTQFWSGESDHCTVSGCTLAEVEVNVPVTVTVADNIGVAQSGVVVYAFDGENYTGYSGTTDENGQVDLTLPAGGYRFRADFNGTWFWSDSANHCAVPGCIEAEVEVSRPVKVVVEDTDGGPSAGVTVYAYQGDEYTGFSAATDAAGEVQFTLPAGEYRFRADLSGTKFWSGAASHCSVPGCESAGVTVTKPVAVSVADTDGAPKEGLKVYAFDGETYTGFSGTTDAAGEVIFTLPQGDYRFRADYNGTKFWSGDVNHCTLPGCESASVAVTVPVTVSVLDWSDNPQADLKVYAFDADTYTGFNATTDAAGEVIFTLPEGSYRFRADADGEQYWSDTENHCTLPGCGSAVVRVGPEPTATATPTPTSTATPTPMSTLTPTATPTATASDTPTPTNTATPTATFTLTQAPTESSTPESTAENTPSPTPAETVESTPEGSLTPTPTASSAPTATEVSGWSAGGLLALLVPDGPGWKVRVLNDEGRLPVMPGRALQDSDPGVVVAVVDTDGTPQEGIAVYAFDGETYTGTHGTTDAAGEAVLDLADGGYRFRADVDGTHFWSDSANHCEVPDCTSAAVTVTKPVLVSVSDTDSTPKEGLKVYAFDGEEYTGYSGSTDAAGEVNFTLPQGDYRFRADMNGTQFWSGTANHCTLPGCETAAVEVTRTVSVSVVDTEGAPKEGLQVYAFDGDTYTGFSGTTDAAGEVSFTLPQGIYRFRVDYNGTQFWSGSANHCALPGCETAAVEVTVPVTVTVAGETGDPYPDLDVYVFDGETYTGFHGVSDENGQVVFTLPQGDYRFRADYDGVQFWSNTENHCAVPGCTEALVEIPGGLGHEEVTIDYTYDPLYRLTAADYASSPGSEVGGTYFHYTYDAVGNRLELDSSQDGVVTYQYDAANRLIEAGGVTYTWDPNGNLLSDETSIYTYNYANMLASVVQDGVTYSYAYNGMGDRLRQTVDGMATNYTLDINTGLTQVLADGTNTYLYGRGRIAQVSAGVPEYFLGDALGSVRQLVDVTAGVKLSQSYEPYGSVLASVGEGESVFQYAEEARDETSLTYLRTRYLESETGRFISRDIWQGNFDVPQTLNRYLYVQNRPILFIDPSGLISQGEEAKEAEKVINSIYQEYGIMINKDWGFQDIRIPYYGSEIETLCKWRSGAWRNLNELKLVKSAIGLVVDEFGDKGAFMRATKGEIKISRVSLNDPIRSFAPPRPISFITGDIVLTDVAFDSSDAFATHTIIHELGHVWDWRNNRRLSIGMATELGTIYCIDSPKYGEICYFDITRGKGLPPGNPDDPYAGKAKIEDWADSFAAYIYDGYYSGKTMRNIIPGGIREQYIREQIKLFK